jgi:hypothetical protein
LCQPNAVRPNGVELLNIILGSTYCQPSVSFTGNTRAYLNGYLPCPQWLDKGRNDWLTSSTLYQQLYCWTYELVNNYVALLQFLIQNKNVTVLCKMQKKLFWYIPFITKGCFNMCSLVTQLIEQLSNSARVKYLNPAITAT